MFGIVLTGRISMLPGIANLSSLYGSTLAGVTWVAMLRFVAYPEVVARALPPGLEWVATALINLGWILLVWWWSYKLVWDCTNVDEGADMSGEGLLQASGSEGRPPRETPPGRQKTSAPRLIAWWKSGQCDRELREKKRIRGVWVIYFSLAALPLFGLGQALIPPADLARRRNCFWLLAVYVASALALLLMPRFRGRGATSGSSA